MKIIDKLATMLKAFCNYIYNLLTEIIHKEMSLRNVLYSFTKTTQMFALTPVVSQN